MHRRIFHILSLAVILSLALTALMPVSPAYAWSGTGHFVTESIGYFDGTPYTVAPNFRQASGTLNAGDSVIHSTDAADVYVSFDFDTTGKSVYLVYTTNGTEPNKANGTSVTATFSKDNAGNRTWVATIPAQVAGTNVRYRFYASDSTLTLGWGRIAGTVADRNVSQYDTSWTETDGAYFEYTVAPTLGAYSNTSVALGNNTSITPSSTPIAATRASVFTDTNFKGTFIADPTTGVVRVINAHPAGTYPVTVKASNAGGSTSTTSNLTVSNGLACTGTSIFTGSTNVSAGLNPWSVAVGDFNNDGKQDLAIVNAGADTVSIGLGDGAGGFTSATPVSVGDRPFSAAVGDFNGDGNQDLAVASFGTAAVSIHLGDGAGGFGAPTNIGLSSSPVSIALGDFNGDGIQDFVTVSWGSNIASIRLGNGTGGFTGSTDVSVGTGPYSVVVGDFNKDGKQDFATANYSSNTVSIRLGDGAGGFTSASDVGVGANPRSIALGDFNGDGNQDIAVSNSGASNVSIRLGDGAGNFSGSTNVSVGAGDAFTLAVGDFNGDGNQDFAKPNSTSTTLSIRLGNGAGAFTNLSDVTVGTSPYGVAVGDFNGDGRQDLVAANNGSSTASVRLGGCEHTVTFDANGGTGTMTPQVSNAAANLTSNTFTRAGYTFAGWSTAADGSGDDYADGASYPFDISETLYAQWTANDYTITFDSAGGSAVADITQAYGSAVTAPAEPTRTGYTFAGWNPALPATMPLNGAALTAQWTANAYTITFDSAGGSAVADITQAFGSVVTAPADPTRAGYIFAGWNPALPATMPLNGAALTAQWTANTYTVTFDGNGGGTPSPASKAVTFDSAYGTLATASRTGYTFNGWYNAPTGGNLVTDTTTVSTASNHILYARWTANTYTVTYDGNGNDGGTVPTDGNAYNIGDIVTVLTDLPSRTGYTFAGWSDGTKTYNAGNTFAMGSSNVTLTAQWTINSYTVTFDSQGGSAVASQNVNYGSLVTEPTVPTRIGYTFNGWYDASTGGNLWNFASNTVSANTTLYARWTTNSSFPTFADVPINYWSWLYIERLYAAGITGGCSTNPLLIYCPDKFVTRAEMAVFLLKSIHGPSFSPPMATGAIFDDVPATHWAAAWIEQLQADGITAGCGNGSYCPDQTATTRAQMAVFLLRGKYGSDYNPPAPSGIFNDVPTDYWAAAWIEQLAVEGITGGCGNGNYCPENPLTRAEMAVFIVKTFNLP